MAVAAAAAVAVSSTKLKSLDWRLPVFSGAAAAAAVVATAKAVAADDDDVVAEVVVAAAVGGGESCLSSLLESLNVHVDCCQLLLGLMQLLLGEERLDP